MESVKRKSGNNSGFEPEQKGSGMKGGNGKGQKKGRRSKDEDSQGSSKQHFDLAASERNYWIEYWDESAERWICK